MTMPLMGVFFAYMTDMGAAIASIETCIRWLEDIAFVLLLPPSLLGLVVRKTRRAGGVGLYAVSWVLGASLWLASLLYTLGVSWVWAIVGILSGGLGVIPVAAIMSLFRGDRSTFGAILTDAALVFATRGLGLWIIGKTVVQPSAEINVSEAPRSNLQTQSEDFERALREFEKLTGAQKPANTEATQG